MTTTAKELAAAWGATFTQHNLLSTATAEQRNAFIKRNIDTYNRLCVPILDAPNQPLTLAEAEFIGADTPRASSVDLLYSYNPDTHPAAAEEVGQMILRNAADYLCNSRPLADADFPAEDSPDALAVELLDALRD